VNFLLISSLKRKWELYRERISFKIQNILNLKLFENFYLFDDFKGFFVFY
jgi:hypothetical protein